MEILARQRRDCLVPVSRAHGARERLSWGRQPGTEFSFSQRMRGKWDSERLLSHSAVWGALEPLGIPASSPRKPWGGILGGGGLWFFAVWRHPAVITQKLQVIERCSPHNAGKGRFLQGREQRSY